MASSAVNFSLTRNGIINRSLKLLNVFGMDESPNSEDYNVCADFLNMMIKFWQTDGINLISRRNAYLILTPDQSEYDIYNLGDHCTNQYYQTAITSDEAAAQTILSVDDTSNMTANDYIGIELDDGTIQWTTIASKTSTTVTVNDALTSQASSGSIVINYTTKIDRPLEIFYAFRRDLSTGGDTQLSFRSEKDWAELYNKTQTGLPNLFVYTPETSIGKLKIWQVPDRFQYAIGFSYLKMIDEYDLASDTSEFPNEFLLPLVYNLAYYVAPIYGKFTEQKMIEGRAGMLYAKVQTFNQENASMRISSTYDSFPRDY